MVKYSMQGFLNEELDLKDKVMDYEEKIHELQRKALKQYCHSVWQKMM